MKNNHGFTFIEIMVATVIIAAAGAGLYGTFVQSARYAQSQRPLAYSEVQTQIDAVQSQWSATTAETVSSGSFSKNLAGIQYDTDMVVSEVAGKDYKKITMTTTWS